VRRLWRTVAGDGHQNIEWRVALSGSQGGGMILPGFLGPYGRSRALAFDVEATYNLFAEPRAAGTPKSDLALIKRPGLQPRYLLPGSPIRAIFSQDGRTFAIGGNAFCELYPNDTFVIRGTVAKDAYPATITSNGQNGFQLFIVSGGLGYIFNLVTSAFGQIASGGFVTPAAMGAFSDSYFISLKRNSNQFNLSALNDGTTWSALDFARTSDTSDNKTSLIVNHSELWLFGTQRTEVWVNVGNTAGGFPYQPIPGTLIEHGIIAPWSAQRLDNTILWLGGDERGANIVFRANGYTPERISTFAVETYLNSVSTTTDAIGWTFQMEGHAFYLLYVPSADETLVYDVSTNEWFLWALWDDARINWIPHVGRCHAFAFSKHLVGDRSSGVVYEQSLDYLTDEIAA
jgi:hypothetical protein